MRLFFQIFLLVALSALIAALSMAVLTSWSLSRGFDAYLGDRDDQRLDEFVEEAQALIANNPSAGLAQVLILIPDRRPDVLPRREGARPRLRPPPMAKRPPREARPPGSPLQRRPLPPPGFMPRLSIYDPDGNRLAGPPMRTYDTGVARRPIRYEGQRVGEVVLLPVGPSPEGVETEFLRDQFTGIALLVLVIFAFAAIAAFFIARRGAALLADIESVASSVANGDFSKRAKVNGSGEIATLASNINQMTQALGDLQESRRTWLAEIGHELRTPLTVLRGELEALGDGIRPLDAAAIQSLGEEANRLSLLVDDLQFLAMSDIARPSFTFTPITVGKLLDTAESRFAHSCASAGHALSFVNQVPPSTHVYWDGARIGQLLANLIKNSSDYTDSPGSIVVSAILKEANIELTVEDSAPGVCQDILMRLFDPLFRAEQSRSRNLGGSGLGLSVCAIIVEEHGGSIWAQPSILGGLVVTASIPVRPQQGSFTEKGNVG